MRKQSPASTTAIQCDLEDARTFDDMAAHFGVPNRRRLIHFLAQAFREGRLVVLDRVTKECLVSAAEERMLAKARKAAREMVLYVLWEEGYRADPYER